MIDAFGNVQNVLIVGGYSEIAQAILCELGKNDTLVNVDLLVRKTSETNNTKIINGHTSEIYCDLNDQKSVLQICDSLFVSKQYDVVVLAAGKLPNPNRQDFSPYEMAEFANVNFLSQIVIGNEAVKHFKHFSKGILILISSVAMERPRIDNFIYGSTKVGMDFWANGLADSLIDSDIRILVVRPGMVKTKMTKDIPVVPFSSTPVEVARVIQRNLHSKRTIIWVPRILQSIFWILRHLPKKFFIRISKVRQ